MVTYVSPYVSGAGFNGTDTFTVITPGVCALQCVLNLANGNAEGTLFSVRINNGNVAPASNARNAGPLVLIRVQHYTANTTVSIMNRSGHNVLIAEDGTTEGSGGHFCLYRIADNRVP